MNAIKIGIVTAVIIGILIGGLYFVFENPIGTDKITTRDTMTFDESWCIENNGLWMGNHCYYENKEDYYLSSTILKESEKSKIIGVTAKKICTILEIQCPSEPVFDAWYNTDEQYSQFSYWKSDVEYTFRITDTEIKYRTSAEPNTWNIEESDNLNYIDKTLVNEQSDTIKKLIELLESGKVSEFNELRAKSEQYLILQDVNAEGVDLTGINLEYLYLARVNLRDANLQDANMYYVTLGSVDLDGANLLGANLQGINLQGAKLGKVNFQDVNLMDADLRNADLVSANLQGTNLQDAILSKANLRDANLQDANLKYAKLVASDLRGANLQGANLEDADLQGSILSKANLKDANLLNTILKNVNLSDVKNLPIPVELAKAMGAIINSDVAVAANTQETLIDTVKLDQFTISDTLKESIRERVDTGTHQSIFVGVIDENGIDQYYYGNIAKDENPIDENTIFETGSISKVFTSLILADMVVNGEISLDNPIDKFLPEHVKTPSKDGKKITLLSLATHTSGLPVMPNYPPNPDLDKEYDYDKEGLYEYLSDFELPREIGSQYEYSNTGGSLLGHVLSLQAGESYEQTLKERVLDKLGMDSTCVHQCDEIRDRFAKPHALGELVDEVGLDEDMAGAGGVRSSGKDMITFLSYAMNLKDSELKESFELTQTANHEINEILSIGLGWHIIQKDEQTIFWHNGATEGFASFFGFDPDSNHGVVVLTNSQVLVDEIGLDVLDFSVEE